MKIKNIVLTLILVTGSTGIFANGNEVINRHAVTSLQREFANAENIQWTEAGPLTKATFSHNGEVLFAYYSENGERVALGRNIRPNQLPINLLSTIKTSYKQSWITDAFEVTKDNETAYYVTIENADKHIILKSVSLDEWMIFKTTYK